MWLQELFNVGGFLTMQGSKFDFKDLELDSEFDAQSV